MSNDKRDPLDEALAALPRDIEPQRDLWPEIRTAIVAAKAEHARSEHGGQGRSNARSRFAHYLSSPSFSLAAGLLLVVVASMVAYVLIERDSRPTARVAHETLPTPALNVQPASFGPALLGEQYAAARAELDGLFEQRLATLPPPAREKLRKSLGDLRRATQEISATLAEHPSDPLLQQLLMTAYQNELRLLADVTNMTTLTSRVAL